MAGAVVAVMAGGRPPAPPGCSTLGTDDVLWNWGAFGEAWSSLIWGAAGAAEEDEYSRGDSWPCCIMPAGMCSSSCWEPYVLFRRGVAEENCCCCCGGGCCCC